MKVLCQPEPGKLEVKDLPMPQCHEGNAIIKMEMCGICGSDVTAYRGTNPTMRYPINGLGHEGVGVITQIGENDKGLKVGDRVALEPYVPCNKCHMCAVGRFNNCADLHVCGLHKDGVMAAMLVADYAAALKREGRSLLQERDALYARYGYMANRLLNVDIEDAVPMERMAAILSALRAKPPKSLCGFAVCSAKDYRDGLDGLPPSNVLSFANEQGCKLIVRPSGTEPKVKLYLSAKGASMEEALRKLDALEADARALVR